MTSQEEQRRADLMARVQPQHPSEDLQWVELEEGEGGGEERGTVGERGGEDEGKDDKERGRGRESREGTLYIFVCVCVCVYVCVCIHTLYDCHSRRHG